MSEVYFYRGVARIFLEVQKKIPNPNPPPPKTPSPKSFSGSLIKGDATLKA